MSASSGRGGSGRSRDLRGRWGRYYSSGGRGGRRPRIALISCDREMGGGGICAPVELSSALSFPSIPICPGTHETSIFALRFSSRNDIAASTNPCDICWLGPGFSSVIASTEDVLSANMCASGTLVRHEGRWECIEGRRRCRCEVERI